MSSRILKCVFGIRLHLLEHPPDIRGFIKAVQICNSEVGLAWHALLAMEQDQQVKIRLHPQPQPKPKILPYYVWV
jgi:hypothetical protein